MLLPFKMFVCVRALVCDVPNVADAWHLINFMFGQASECATTRQVPSNAKMCGFFDGVDFVRPLNDEIIVCICMMNNILKGFCKQLVM